MVRRIRHCSCCRKKFISQANEPFCSRHCYAAAPQDIKASLLKKSIYEIETPSNSNTSTSTSTNTNTNTNKNRTTLSSSGISSSSSISSRSTKANSTASNIGNGDATTDSRHGEQHEDEMYEECDNNNNNSNDDDINDKNTDADSDDGDTEEEGRFDYGIVRLNSNSNDDDDDDNENDEVDDAMSEGGDDFYCSQLEQQDDGDYVSGGEGDGDDDEGEDHLKVSQDDNFGESRSAVSSNTSQNSSFLTTGFNNDADSSSNNNSVIASEGNLNDNSMGRIEIDQWKPKINNILRGPTETTNRKIPPSKLSSTTTATATKGTTADSNDDVCFICGKSLVGMKHRVDHIKRCTRKFGISGRDVRQEDDDGGGDLTIVAGESTTSTSKSEKKIFNPYSPSKRQSDWHGDAKTMLTLTDNHQPTSSMVTTSTTSMVQSSITKTFQQVRPRNALNVLLAGARKQAKEESIFKKRAAAFADTKDGGENGSMANGGWDNNNNNNKKRGRWGQNKNYKSTNTPAYKKIAGTDFNVDGFFYANPSVTNNYFLTHFHSDHYGGITKTWNAGTIYCSLPTATLVHEQLRVDKKFIHPLPMMTPTVIETNKNKFNHKPVTVTLLDANHCPGAVMFLFEIPSANGNKSRTKRILHVGDFRWNRSFMLGQAPLSAIAKNDNIVLDELYLDTTYCNPKYELPSQQDAIGAIIDVFEKEQNRQRERGKGRTLHLFGAYTIGKEKMYLSVAERFGLRVYVDTSRYRVLSALHWSKERMKIFTTCKEEACIWVVPLSHINFKNMGSYFSMANTKPFAKQYDHICGYRPTGWSMSGKPSSASGKNCVASRKNGSISIHSVPYSEHSSFPELVDCLKVLRPMSIIPTVSTSKSDEQLQTLMKGVKTRQTNLLDFSP